MTTEPAAYAPKHPPYQRMTHGRVGGYTFGCGRHCDADVIQVALTSDYQLVTLGTFRDVCTDLDQLVQELAIWMTECVCPSGLRAAPLPTTLTTATGYRHTRCNWDHAHNERHRRWLCDHLDVTSYARGDLTWTPPPLAPLTREGHPGAAADLRLAAQRMAALPRWSRTLHDNDVGGPWDRYNHDAIGIGLSGEHTVITHQRVRIVTLLRPKDVADQLPSVGDIQRVTYARGDLTWTPRCGRRPEPGTVPPLPRRRPPLPPPVAFPRILVYPLQVGHFP